MILKISGGRIISGKKVYDNTGIFVENGLLCHERSSFDAEIDATGLFITAGFIDIHTHGALMKSFYDGTIESYDTISTYQASHGVSSVVGAIATMPMPEILRCCMFMRSVAGRDFQGARILGLHIEGPFISAENKGAQRLEDIKNSEPEYYEQLLPYIDVIKIMTVAPDNDNAVNMIKKFASCGIILNGGHDNSHEPYIIKAIDAGMTHVTHLFCAMSSMRKIDGKKYLGLTECALEDDRLTVELIADGHHTSARLVRLAYKTKGADGMCLVSDLSVIGGMSLKDGSYEISIPGVPVPRTIVVENGEAKTPDLKNHAGSTTAIDTMLKNVVSWGIPLAHAIEMITATPARIINEYDRIGSLDIGKLADITLLSPALDVVKTIVGGNIVYEK